MSIFRLFRKRLGRRKGFTLTELIVVTVLMAVIMAMVVAFATPIRSMVTNTDARSDATVINKILGDYIERRLSYANHIDVYAGMDVTLASGDDQTALNKSISDLHDIASATGEKNSPRVMVFKFVENTDTTLNTFKVYDLPVSGTTPSSYNFALNDKDLVFTDDFYGDYRYFISFHDTSVEKAKNPAKNSYSLNFRIDSYNPTGDVVDGSSNPIGFDLSHIQHYYKQVADGKDPDDDEDAMIKFVSEKIGSENVSFQLKNIHQDSQINIHFGKKNASAASDYRGDIYVFYNVKTYEIP